tara:strand:+ start:216 stop:2486 length:2271 start_codon:yes stop_codon:yes gene_type:complete
MALRTTRHLAATTARAVQIACEVAWVVAAYPVVRSRSSHAQLAQRSVARLGTVFIKMGQTLSTRPDIVPREYLVALAELQDRVPPFETDIAHRQIAAQLGLKRTSDVFSAISAEPVAAASLGQVYRATLREGGPWGGRDVALKVQRPGLRAQIGADAMLMRTSAGVMQMAIRVATTLAGSRQASRTDLVAFIDEIIGSLRREIDYELEADACERFHALYCGSDRLVEGIAAPRVLRHLSTAEVLCLTWMEGERLGDAAARGRRESGDGDQDEGSASERGQGGLNLSGVAVEDLLDRGVRFSLQSMLLEGFFHADPHPGNMLVVPRRDRESGASVGGEVGAGANAGAGADANANANAGAAGSAAEAGQFDLVFLDFGMMGELPRTARIGLLGVVVHLWQLHDVTLSRERRDAAALELAEALSTIGFLAPGSDLRALASELEAEFAPGLRMRAVPPPRGTAATAPGNTHDATASHSASWSSTHVSSSDEFDEATFTFADALSPLLQVIARVGRLPQWFPAVFRALVTLEGAAVAVDPSFEVMRRAMPAVAQILVVDRHSARSSEVLRALLLDARADAVRWSRVELLLSQALKSSEALLPRDSASVSWGGELASAGEDVAHFVARSGDDVVGEDEVVVDKVRLRSSIVRDVAGALEFALERIAPLPMPPRRRDAAEEDADDAERARELLRVLDIVGTALLGGASSGDQQRRLEYGAHLAKSSARLVNVAARSPNIRVMVGECALECAARGAARVGVKSK